ncbi:hypothetical protein AB0M02_22740 [Actinoplanes sp. NPDC051861]|uniref:hypothetical protein n=1 Tax=Actinoplanes sp. NPDC051861 TaxID=3155170 RepID=UPI003415D25F
MTQFEARTLAEAYMFVDLVVGRNKPVDLTALTDLDYVDGNRVLRVNGWHDGEEHDFTIVTPGRTGDTRPGELYGTGREPSLIIDAGQWRAVEDFAASNIAALVQQAAGGPLSPDEVNEIANNVEVAYSALAEIGKFLPDNAVEVPDEAFWSEIGRTIREQQPEAFRRERLVEYEAQYRAMADQINAARG